MKKSLTSALLLLSTLMTLSSCTQDDYDYSNYIPEEDLANNYCVYSSTYNGSCDYTENQTNGDGIPRSWIESYLNSAIKKVQDGADGVYNRIIDSDYTVNNQCNEGSHKYSDPWAEFGSYAYYVSYECAGIAVDINVYGPYVSQQADQMAVQHENELIQDGYTIGYTEYENASSNLVYIVIYSYKENARNAKQAQVIEGFKILKAKAMVFGDDHKPLLDSVKTVKSFTITEAQEKSVDQAITFLKKLKSIRVDQVKKMKK